MQRRTNKQPEKSGRADKPKQKSFAYNNSAGKTVNKIVVSWQHNSPKTPYVLPKKKTMQAVK